MIDYVHTRCDQKITVILKFRELSVFDFRIFFLLCCYTCLLHMVTMSVILDCQFVFDR